MDYWGEGKWLYLVYLQHLGYECALHAFVRNQEEFRELMVRYKIKFEDALEMKVNEFELQVQQVKALFEVRESVLAES